MQIASKPRWSASKRRPGEGGRVKAESGAGGGLRNGSGVPHCHLPSLCPPAFRGFPWWLPSSDLRKSLRGDKYLLSSYYVPGATEMAENKRT